jgi:hypothetical protein
LLAKTLWGSNRLCRLSPNYSTIQYAFVICLCLNVLVVLQYGTRLVPKSKPQLFAQGPFAHRMEQGVICQNRGFPTIWLTTVLLKVPHFDRSLPVEDSGLLLRCFLLFAWQMVGRVSMTLCRRAVGAGGAVSSCFAGSWGPNPAVGTERPEAFGTLLASGVQRLVALQVAEEDVGRLRRSHGEVYVLRLQVVGVGGPASGVADVRERNVDGVCCGRGSLSEALGCPYS